MCCLVIEFVFFYVGCFVGGEGVSVDGCYVIEMWCGNRCCFVFVVLLDFIDDCVFCVVVDWGDVMSVDVIVFSECYGGIGGDVFGFFICIVVG